MKQQLQRYAALQEKIEETETGNALGPEEPPSEFLKQKKLGTQPYLRVKLNSEAIAQDETKRAGSSLDTTALA